MSIAILTAAGAAKGAAAPVNFGLWQALNHG